MTGDYVIVAADAKGLRPVYVRALGLHGIDYDWAIEPRGAFGFRSYEAAVEFLRSKNVRVSASGMYVVRA